ncbi:hypothetical protein B0H15DRAFT_794417 [Mycena belliarum]|uniref:Uncharacterized protein n=1 Tax=Mycena belliarum TaxID=1033014 RepID=A0AAD6TNA3_9AGAR|nr:hypothetical protein B0H15DRAFT_794417 [Mycena belliae]
MTARLIRIPDIRIEWTKGRARADRWQEELILLEEEMRRVLQYCAWKANWWDQRRYSRKGVSPELAEGLCADATEQAARERRWLDKWQSMWHAVRQRTALVLADVLVDVEDAMVVEIEEEVAYGEEGELDDLD